MLEEGYILLDDVSLLVVDRDAVVDAFVDEESVRLAGDMERLAVDGDRGQAGDEGEDNEQALSVCFLGIANPLRSHHRLTISGFTMGLASAFYNAFARRNSVYVSTIFASAFAFSIGFDQATTAFWDNRNKGKQWKDIRSKYVEQE
ncbi:hypothetical protein FRC06_005491 [Ceratobasidium sp. 370]|nr:hypothetical protein FRC06_005491 [Ceratobasidium sp. 370]